MARRKARKIQVKKQAKQRLEKTFSCPFCNEENSVTCRLDRSKMNAVVKCRVCQAGYQTVINALSEAVDVFAEWVDAIHAREEAQAVRKIENQDEKPTSPPQQTINENVSDDETFAPSSQLSNQKTNSVLDNNDSDTNLSSDSEDRIKSRNPISDSESEEGEDEAISRL